VSEETILNDALGSARDTRQLLVGRRVLGSVVELFCSQFSVAPAVIVADENTFEAAGRVVNEALDRLGHPVMRPIVFSDPNFYAEHKYVEQLQSRIASHDAIPIAVGSGTINDITKLAAHRVGRPYMCVATAASMDGYTAFGASITHEGSKQTFDCPAPRAVLVDLNVIGAAPREMNAWGYADLLAKMTAGADWVIADELGVEPIDANTWRMVQTPLRDWTSDQDGIRNGDPRAIGHLIYGLLVSGFAMQATKSSRPASGAEHQFSHLWDMQRATDASHGAKVGVATVAVARFYEATLQQALDRIDVEAIISNWPDMESVTRDLDKLFHRDTGPRPVTVDSHGPDARVTDEAILQKAKLETGAKHPSRQQLRDQLLLLRDRWPRLKSRLHEHLIPSRELAKMLESAGAPTRPEQIGISRRQLRDSFVPAYHIRRRFTVLDLAVRSGTLDACLSGMEDSHVDG
jgi:glycerol-1-phosphate dehydrogenase [NAD(P)+]